MPLTNVEKARRKALLEQGLKKCSMCSIVKSVDEFFTDNYSKLDRLYTCCKECKSNSPSRIESRKRGRDRRNQEFKEYKKTLECKNCGYNEDPTKLEFHHRNPAEKLFTVAERDRDFGTPKVSKEIAKCDVLCQPCHTDEHRTQ